jgi:hypothetical protein
VAIWTSASTERGETAVVDASVEASVAGSAAGASAGGAGSASSVYRSAKAPTSSRSNCQPGYLAAQIASGAASAMTGAAVGNDSSFATSSAWSRIAACSGGSRKDPTRLPSSSHRQNRCRAS